MADHSKIEWTDATWNPITGCSVVSPGCTNCYAMKLAGTRLRHHPSRADLTTMSKAGPVWNGQVRFNEQWLNQPLRWKRPRMIFVCAHGDLFHENVPDKWIERVFAVMALCPQHVFQVLTKRPERLRAWMTDAEDHLQDRMRSVDALIESGGEHGGGLDEWPLPNVWLGVSAEDQDRADERIPLLLETPAAVRWVSAEPLLGGVNLRPWLGSLDWVVAGGESGPDARPMHPTWARSLRDQCAKAGVAFHFKQWGAWHSDSLLFTDMEGRCPPPDMRIGKKAAGRSLDGLTHDGFPDPPQ